MKVRAVKNSITEEKDLSLFLNEHIEPAEVENFLNNCYAPKIIPFCGLVPTGQIIRQNSTMSVWEDIENLYIEDMRATLEEEILATGEASYSGFRLFEVKENDSK